MHQLRQDPRVGVVTGARNGLDALRQLRGNRFDAVFLDVNMPQLDGIELAAVLAGLKHRPLIVFVTAHDSHAAEAYALDAVDYVLKALRAERVQDALNRIERRLLPDVPGEVDDARVLETVAEDDLAAVKVDDGRRRFFVRRDAVQFAESHRDYVHLHAGGENPGVHVLRIPLSVLESKWQKHGFLRVHRSYLINLRYVTELARDPMGAQLVRVAGQDLSVSRRMAAALRDRVDETSRRGANQRR